MKLKHLHPWDLSPRDAVALQARLLESVSHTTPHDFNPRLVAGIDISCNRFSPDVFAAVVVLSLPDLRIVETRTASGAACFPYVPGLLAFREIPAAAAALEQLRTSPDVFLFDGHGAAHPRGMGLAVHAGLLLGRPSIGCAKSLLTGSVIGRPAPGRPAPLEINGRTVGAAVLTRPSAKPVFVSPGHLIDLTTSVSLVLACSAGRRIPEPTRLAHIAANELRRKLSGQGT